eukprot:3484941-Pleurochrysis_carterae.AAC.1
MSARRKQSTARARERAVGLHGNAQSVCTKKGRSWRQARENFADATQGREPRGKGRTRHRRAQAGRRSSLTLKAWQGHVHNTCETTCAHMQRRHAPQSGLRYPQPMQLLQAFRQVRRRHGHQTRQRSGVVGDGARAVAGAPPPPRPACARAAPPPGSPWSRCPAAAPLHARAAAPPPAPPATDRRRLLLFLHLLLLHLLRRRALRHCVIGAASAGGATTRRRPSGASLERAAAAQTRDAGESGRRIGGRSALDASPTTLLALLDPTTRERKRAAAGSGEARTACTARRRAR